MSDLPKRVTIDEEGPREGFQSEKKMIPVADKVRLIEALADTGLKRIACVSYVNPKRVPTMADAEEVASRIDRKPGVQYSALWLNQQALNQRFEHLVLVADPASMGELRPQLHPQVSARTRAEITKDWTRLGIQDIAQALAQVEP